MKSIHSDWSWAFLQHPLIPVILRFAWTSSNHLSFGLPTFLFSSSFAFNTILRARNSRRKYPSCVSTPGALQLWLSDLFGQHFYQNRFNLGLELVIAAYLVALVVSLLAAFQRLVGTLNLYVNGCCSCSLFSTFS
jgi:hypothetical protein